MQKVINISTSAQICISINSDLLDSIELPKSVSCFPYFKNKVLLVSASLNGGNVIEKFVEMVANWNQNLGVDVEREIIWQKLIDQAEKSDSSVHVNPVLYAERHDRLTFGSIANLRYDNLSVGQIFKGVCQGLIKNLHSMMAKDLILKFKCERIVATGGALIRNSVLRSSLESEFDYLPIVYKSSTDAAYDDLKI
ncbi:sedoheptulokinase isoform X1 [Brachionus plicatilis]|uniref:Sedoheptulokinase isoform X1 n=1 Tax=Brachionus plicatilis TaxID=10195 RepID=A0A3M7SVR4_BRAPC|nr:sedoheptulokinase isoform X1 [Brachionus plicatilis]